jgi:hypothetical protein
MALNVRRLAIDGEAGDGTRPPFECEPFPVPNPPSEVSLVRGTSMSDNQAGKSKSMGSGGKIALLGAVATALALVNMSTGSEAQSAPVLILEYIALAGGLLALVGGLIMMQRR